MLSYADRLLEVGEHERALDLAGGALHIAGLRNDTLGMAHAYRRLGQAMLRIGRQGEAVLHLRKAVRALEEADDREVAQQTALELAEALDAAGDRNGALGQYDAVLRNALTLGDRNGAAVAHEAIGTIHGALGDQRAALRSFLAALELREELGDDNAIALALANLGIVFGQLGEYRQALEYFTRALAMARRGGNRLLEVRTLVNASRAHYSLGELDPALEIAFKALAIYDELGDDESIPGVLSDIGSIHERRGELDVALDYHRKALDYLRGKPPDQLQVRLFLSVANLYNRAAHHSDALAIATQAIELAHELEDPSLEYQLHLALSTSYEGLGDYRRALEHFRWYSKLRDEVQGAEMRRSIAEMQVRFDVERTAREREIYRLKSEQLEQDMEHKKSELTAMALNQIQKNELLERLTEQIRELGRAPAADVRRQARTLLNQIADGRSADDSWKTFEQQLGLLHGDFVARLSARCPSLSPTELKICSLLKLGLSSKQIAELMGTVERTIENHRYRIKNKIDPGGGGRLGTLIAGI
ncbi:MAG TPA: LuxR family transcriptional regulator [Candidatus Kapabacteria bacterium]|nr:LuxR family transcriptional regulator [Candidatus Kapabacteria bacterium]